MEYKVTIFYYRSKVVETPSIFEERHIAPGVTEVVEVVPSKVLSKDYRELEFTESVKAISMVEAIKTVVRHLREKAEIEDWYKSERLPDGNWKWETWDIEPFEPYAKVEWEGKIEMIGKNIIPNWWLELGPRSRFIGEIRGGGVTINLNPFTGPQVTPWPTPPLPDPPWLTHEEKKRLFEQVEHPIRWKYPTIPARFTALKDAIAIAWSINDFQGAAELWELPNGLGYAVTSKGYLE